MGNATVKANGTSFPDYCKKVIKLFQYGKVIRNKVEVPLEEGATKYNKELLIEIKQIADELRRMEMLCNVVYIVIRRSGKYNDFEADSYSDSNTVFNMSKAIGIAITEWRWTINALKKYQVRDNNVYKAIKFKEDSNTSMVEKDRILLNQFIVDYGLVGIHNLIRLTTGIDDENGLEEHMVQLGRKWLLDRGMNAANLFYSNYDELRKFAHSYVDLLEDMYRQCGIPYKNISEEMIRHKQYLKERAAQQRETQKFIKRQASLDKTLDKMNQLNVALNNDIRHAGIENFIGNHMKYTARHIVNNYSSNGRVYYIAFGNENGTVRYVVNKYRQEGYGVSDKITNCALFTTDQQASEWIAWAKQTGWTFMQCGKERTLNDYPLIQIMSLMI